MHIDSHLPERHDHWRANDADGPSRADAAPRLFALAPDDRPDDMGDGPRLSDGEKLIAFMLSSLLTAPDKDNAWLGALVEKAIAGGHYWALDRELRKVFHDDRDSPDDVGFVADVLEMWDLLELSFEGLGEEDQARLAEAVPHFSEVRFPGFDANHEGRCLSIARFMVKDLGRFERFGDHPRHLDSHHLTVGLYRAMLGAFEPIRKQLIGRTMTASEMIAVLGG